MSDSLVGQGKLTDIVFFGMRASIGIIFIIHGMAKFSPGFAEVLPRMGLQPELQIPIALAELIPGILLFIGVLTRLSGALLSIIMLGAIFMIKGVTSLTGDMGYEFDLILLASSLVIMIAGPGRVSISHIIQKIPRPLQ
ncbi:MAG: DoxX family protein [Candidatus Nitrosoabyssus spongiisocia]|nr:MAG: DoxX family protein [Nitrosopumilaceae archaeon AB1(1)]